eukprot:5531917-Pyramimonas_sp.AAC.1
MSRPPLVAFARGAARDELPQSGARLDGEELEAQGVTPPAASWLVGARSTAGRSDHADIDTPSPALDSLAGRPAMIMKELRGCRIAHQDR